MENPVDGMLEKLAQIEDTAVGIMESANEKKKELADEMDLKTKAFDNQLEKETKKKLEDIQEKFEKEKETELSKLKNDTVHALKVLDHKYEKEHKKWVDSIVASVTQV